MMQFRRALNWILTSASLEKQQGDWVYIYESKEHDNLETICQFQILLVQR